MRFTQNKHLFFVFGSITGAVFFVATSVFAVPPASTYNPGDTLDPSCVPGSANCSVSTSNLSGTTNTIPKFTAANTLGDSGITDNGSLVSIGSALSARTLTVAINNTNNYVDPA